MSKPNLTDTERIKIVVELLRLSDGGYLAHGVRASVAKKFGVSQATSGRLWKRFCFTEGKDAVGEWRSQIKYKPGSKRKDRDEIKSRVRAVPIADRTPMRRLADSADVSVYLVQALIREGALHVQSARIKPRLTDINKFRRIEFALTFIDNDSMKFEPMFDMVHVDEKWFYEDTNKRTCLVFEDETPPLRCRQSKRFIPKTMFLAAVSRPT